MEMENLTKQFTAPDRQSSLGGIVEGSYLDKHREELIPVLLGDAKLSDKLERGLPRQLSRNARFVLREGLEKSRLGSKNLKKAFEEIGLYAEIPLDGKSEYVDTIWVKRYLRGYLKAIK